MTHCWQQHCLRWAAHWTAQVALRVGVKRPSCIFTRRSTVHSQEGRRSSHLPAGCMESAGSVLRQVRERQTPFVSLLCEIWKSQTQQDRWQRVVTRGQCLGEPRLTWLRENIGASRSISPGRLCTEQWLQSTILFHINTKAAKKLDLNCSHRRKGSYNYTKWQAPSATVAIIPQYINASNPHTVHLKPTQCYTSIAFQLKDLSIAKRTYFNLNKITIRKLKSVT